MQKARRHPLRDPKIPVKAPTACKHMVSGSISLPSRGAFHLSLTVLVHYRSLEVFSLGQWSARFPTLETFRVVLESSDRRLIRFRVLGYHHLWLAVPGTFR